MTKLLLTGGSGHVSGAICQEALKRGFDVTTITRGQRPLPDGAKHVICDRQNPEAFKAAVADLGDFDVVVDAVCYRPEDLATMLDFARIHAKQFLFISTDFVFRPECRKFPQPWDAPTLEDDGNGLQVYGYRKRICEKMLLAEPDLKWTAFRPCHIYGPASLLGCYPRHCRDAAITDTLASGNEITLVDGGHDLQQPISSSDLAKLVLSAVGNDKANRGLFHAAGPDIVESWQYYKIIADALGSQLKVKSVPRNEHLMEKPGDFPFLCHRIYDNSIYAKFGLEAPATSLVEGLNIHLQALLKKHPVALNKKEWEK